MDKQKKKKPGKLIYTNLLSELMATKKKRKF